jgi:hypothetical protein
MLCVHYCDPRSRPIGQASICLSKRRDSEDFGLNTYQIVLAPIARIS